MTPRPAVFLDRDGVLNEPLIRDGRPYPPRSVADFRLLPGAAAACEQLRADGYALVVVTNQPDVARGTLAREDLDRIHARLRELIPLDGVYACLHDDADGCACRKPRPGMMLDAASHLSLDLRGSAMIGDRWRDIEAARRAGVRSVHLSWDYDEPGPVGADVTVTSLSDAVGWIRRTGPFATKEES